MSLEDYDIMFEEQKGVCAICHKKESRKEFLSIDHCHETGRVRGLLCTDCNQALGLLKDDTQVMLRAVQYLEDSG